jgi:hypothetical protein
MIFAVIILTAGFWCLVMPIPEGWQDDDGFHYGKEPPTK